MKNKNFLTSIKQCSLCQHFHQRTIQCIAIVVCSVFLTACQVEIYQGLDENQANSMLTLLLKHGIHAEKVSAGKKGFSISVDDKTTIQALEILRENNLPRENFDSLGKVFTGQGMISSAAEEQARLSFALSQELADTFSRIDGVLTSRVHVVLASTDQTTGEHTPPSAGVFLRHTPESQVTTLVPNIRELTSKSIPGLTYDQVAVMLVPVRETVGVPMQATKCFLGIPIPSTSTTIPYLLIAATVTLIISILMLIIIGVYTFVLHYKKKAVSASTGDSE